MNVSVRSVLAGAVVVGLVYGAVALAADGEAPAAAELDIVARTAVRAHPDHTRMVQRELAEYTAECLKGLVSGSAALQEPPKDGAARFRLFIQHTAAVKTAGSPNKETVLSKKGYYTPFLVTTDKGVYKFRLAEWKDSKYVTLEQWTSPYAAVHRMPLADKFNSRQMPAIRQRALMQAHPTHVKHALLDHILPIRIGQSRGKPGATQYCQVMVKNASRWTLKSVEAILQWPDPRTRGQARYKGTVKVTTPLAPGKQTVVPCKGEPVTLDYRWQYLEPMSIYASPVFAPAQE